MVSFSLTIDRSKVFEKLFVFLLFIVTISPQFDPLNQITSDCLNQAFGFKVQRSLYISKEEGRSFVLLFSVIQEYRI